MNSNYYWDSFYQKIYTSFMAS